MSHGATNRNRDVGRLQAIISASAFKKVKKIADDQGLYLADFVRDAVQRRCEELGYQVDLGVGMWGGKRDGSGRKPKQNVDG